MTIKYKLSDLAKDLGVQNKDLIDLFTQWTGEVKKHTSQLTEEELNRVFEHYTRDGEVQSLDEYLNSATQSAEPKKQAKQPAQKRKERVRMPKPEKEQKPAPQKREVVTVTVDTSSADVNLD